MTTPGKEVYRDCTKCGEPVHRNAKVTCKACGEASPWAIKADADNVPPNVPGQPPVGADATGDQSIAQTIVDMDRMLDSISSGDVVDTMLELNPTDEQVAAFVAKRPNRDAEALAERTATELAENGPHVFMQPFSCMIGPVMGHFKVNQVVSDFPLLQALKAENAPMVALANAPGMACCPKCSTVFQIPKIIPARRAG